ncbi:MAG: hypothetical protein CVT47_02585, partial [Thermoplasmata archaeon HGW-Thermoplasmata-2]
MKKESRIIGIDDGPFTFDREGKKHRAYSVPVAGVVMRGSDYVEGVLITSAMVDGNDATEKIAGAVRRSRFKKQIRAILINGGAVGGFNVIDISRLYELTGVPVVTLTRHKPDFAAIEKALKKHFPDWKERLRLLKRRRFASLPTNHNPLFAKYVGLRKEDVQEIVSFATKRGAMPECLRIAHLVASAIVRGESYG